MSSARAWAHASEMTSSLRSKICTASSPGSGHGWRPSWWWRRCSTRTPSLASGDGSGPPSCQGRRGGGSVWEREAVERWAEQTGRTCVGWLSPRRRSAVVVRAACGEQHVVVVVVTGQHLRPPVAAGRKSSSNTGLPKPPRPRRRGPGCVLSVGLAVDNPHTDAGATTVTRHEAGRRGDAVRSRSVRSAPPRDHAPPPREMVPAWWPAVEVQGRRSGFAKVQSYV